MATSAKTPDLEIKVQDRVKHWLIDELGYTYLGNLRDTENTNIREDKLREHLVACGYSKELIDKAIDDVIYNGSFPPDMFYFRTEKPHSFGFEYLHIGNTFFNTETQNIFY